MFKKLTELNRPTKPHKGHTMKIFLTNLAEYNNGVLQGQWITLPMDSEDLAEVIEQIAPNSEECFISDFECDHRDITEYENITDLNEEAEQIDDLDQETADKIEALKAYHGEHYYNSIEEAKNATDEHIGMIINGVSNDFELAKALEYNEGLEDELLMILGCSAEAYEQLASYIRTEDLAFTLNQEFSFYYVNNTAYQIYN